MVFAELTGARKGVSSVLAPISSANNGKEATAGRENGKDFSLGIMWSFRSAYSKQNLLKSFYISLIDNSDILTQQCETTLYDFKSKIVSSLSDRFHIFTSVLFILNIIPHYYSLLWSVHEIHIRFVLARQSYMMLMVFLQQIIEFHSESLF